MRKVLITGGCGFIGSWVVRHFVKSYPDTQIVNVDLLTYSGSSSNVEEVKAASNYRFYQGDIADKAFVFSLFENERFDAVIHLAAESHVDRSILGPLPFVETNVLGTCVLLTAATKWGCQKFYHISTDEVFGALGPSGLFTETTPYAPRSPYAASKASADHFVRAWQTTYGLPIVISNCTNNFGPYQHLEKLIPLTIHRMLEGKPVPIYGDGCQVRDWLYVEDHVRAIDTIFHKGRPGHTYMVGGENEQKNIDVVYLIADLVDETLKRTGSRDLIEFVEDRLGHDRRYGVDATKLQNELGWRPLSTFTEAMRKTVAWYLERVDWIKGVEDEKLQEFFSEQYATRLSTACPVPT